MPVEKKDKKVEFVLGIAVLIVVLILAWASWKAYNYVTDRIAKINAEKTDVKLVCKLRNETLNSQFPDRGLVCCNGYVSSSNPHAASLGGVDEVSVCYPFDYSRYE